VYECSSCTLITVIKANCYREFIFRVFRFEQIGLFDNSVKSTLSVKVGPIDCPETSVSNYHYSLSNNPEERGFLIRRNLNVSAFSAANKILNERADYELGCVTAWGIVYTSGCVYCHISLLMLFFLSFLFFSLYSNLLYSTFFFIA
jgi:hypothetical protein